MFNEVFISLNNIWWVKHLDSDWGQKIWRKNTSLSVTTNNECNAQSAIKIHWIFFCSPKSSFYLQCSQFPFSYNISICIYQHSIFVSSFCSCVFSTAKEISYTVQAAQMHSRTPKSLQNKVQMTFFCILHHGSIYCRLKYAYSLLSFYRLYLEDKFWISWHIWVIIMLFVYWSWSSLSLTDGNYSQELSLYPQSSYKYI